MIFILPFTFELDEGKSTKSFLVESLFLIFLSFQQNWPLLFRMFDLTFISFHLFFFLFVPLFPNILPYFSLATLNIIEYPLRLEKTISWIKWPQICSKRLTMRLIRRSSLPYSSFSRSCFSFKHLRLPHDAITDLN